MNTEFKPLVWLKKNELVCVSIFCKGGFSEILVDIYNNYHNGIKIQLNFKTKKKREREREKQKIPSQKICCRVVLMKLNFFFTFTFILKFFAHFCLHSLFFFFFFFFFSHSVLFWAYPDTIEYRKWLILIKINWFRGVFEASSFFTRKIKCKSKFKLLLCFFFF